VIIEHELNWFETFSPVWHHGFMSLMCLDLTPFGLSNWVII